MPAASACNGAGKASSGQVTPENIGDEWRHIATHPSLLLVLGGIAGVYPLTISYLYAADQPVERPALVVDDDGSALSRELGRRLDATQGLAVRERLATVYEGLSAVRGRHAELLVYVPADFSAQVKRREQAALRVWVDCANLLSYSSSYVALTDVVASLHEDLGAALFLERGVPADLAAERTGPIRRDERFLFHPSQSYGDFLVTGVFLVVLQQMLLVGLAFSAGLRREAGAAPQGGATLFGRGLAQAAVTAGGAALVGLVVVPAFDWTLGSPRAALVVFAAFVAAVLPVAVLVAALVRDRATAFQVLMFASAPLYMLSGFAWPLELMPPAVQAVAALFPSTPALRPCAWPP